MKKIVLKGPGGAFTPQDSRVEEPPPGWVRIRVQACGVCHSDSLTKEGALPGIVYPRAPGHEIAGVIDALGANTEPWKAGDRVGVGWYGGHCGRCESCRRGDFVTCIKLMIPGISYDGGYAEFVTVPREALAQIPESLAPEEAAPLMCAGITTFNALRHSGARPGDLVAIQGIGGLGHLAIQFASRFGFHTVAVGRGADKKDLAIKLGAHAYLDSSSGNIARELAAMGGARVILATAPDARAMGAMADGLSVGGKLVVVGVSLDPLPISPAQLVPMRRSIVGWPSGTAIDSEDTLRFAAANGVRPMIETFALDRAADAYERMITGKVRFRSVLKI